MVTCGVPYTGDILFKTQLLLLLLCLLLPTPGNIQHDNNFVFFYCFIVYHYVPSCIDAFVYMYLQQQLMLTSVADYFIENGRVFFVVFFFFASVEVNEG